MWRFAIQNLLSRPLRSLLALAGLSVAITGMVGLFSFAEGIDKMVHDTFDRIPGLGVMQSGAPIPLFSRIPRAWGDEIENIEGVHVVNPEIWTRANLINGKRIVAPPRFFFGTGIAARRKLKRDVYRDAMVEGRFLNETDRGKLHTVISRQIAEDHQVSVGKTLNVNGDDLKIVGIYHCGQLMLDVAIISDIDVVRQLTRFDANSVCAFYVEQDGTVSDEELSEAIRGRFRGREVMSRPDNPLAGGLATGHPLIDLLLAVFQWTGAARPGISGDVDDDAEPIEVRSADDWSERFDEFSTDLNIFLSVMTGIGVVIAVLSIINTMLMSVTERLIEFGILKANGWSRQNVMLLITIESAMLGVVGGACGCLLGFLGTQLFNSNWPDRIQLYASPQLLVYSFLFSILLGVLGGLYPATWAMRLSPMEAIRRG